MKYIFFLLIAFLTTIFGFAQSSFFTPMAQKVKERMTLVSVKEGNFLMGSNSEPPAHEVTLSAFTMSNTETTNDQFVCFLNDYGIGSSSVFNGKPMLNPITRNSSIVFNDGRWCVKLGFEKYPIDFVSWYGATEYCKWIGGRLPTEAEWEYASKGGIKSQHYTYSGSNLINEVAWFSKNASSPQKVGIKKSNELGLFDLSGNVWEWCSDYKGEYPNGPVINPTGPDQAVWRIIRGGSCNYDSSFCSSVYRNFYTTTNNINLYWGFRPVFTAKVKQTNILVRQNYERKKYGLFVHYVSGLTKNDNGSIPTIDELANHFDAKQFAEEAAEFGVEYVIFTAWHANTRTLYPSQVNKKWRDDSRPIGSSSSLKSYSDRDVILDLANELEKKGIDLHLYVNPKAEVGTSNEEQQNTGWKNWKENKETETWNKYLIELYGEISKRYGTRIKGYWIDALVFDHLKEEQFRDTILANNPNLILLGNLGILRDANPRPEWIFPDYGAWEIANADKGKLSFRMVNPNVNGNDANTWPATKAQVAMVVGSNWWANNKKADAMYSSENLFRYLVLQASISNNGGFAISAGCFPGTAKESSNGNLWEGNFFNTMVQLNSYVKPIAESIKNTNAGKAYVTVEHSWLNESNWGVSTESPDSKYVYLHIVHPPKGKILYLDAPADKSIFSLDAIHLETKQKISLRKTTSGYEVSLPNNLKWDALDNVIRLERMGYSKN